VWALGAHHFPPFLPASRTVRLVKLRGAAHMQHYPGFASRLDAAFGALTDAQRGGGAWRVADTARALPPDTGAPSHEEEEEEEEEEDEEGFADGEECATAAFCKALDAEPEFGPDDAVACGGGSPRPDPATHTVADSSDEDDDELQRAAGATARGAAPQAVRASGVPVSRRGATLYVLDKPLLVGSGGDGGADDGGEEGAAGNVDAWRAAAAYSTHEQRHAVHVARPGPTELITFRRACTCAAHVALRACGCGVF
jgi:hypothetical protein